MADTDDCLKRVDGLLAHADFSIKNPNKVGALVGAFAGNLRRFHAADGSGYRWLADSILEVLPRSAYRDSYQMSTRKLGRSRQYTAARLFLVGEGDILRA